MKKSLFAFALLLSICINGWAQLQRRITGRVVNKDQVGIEGATLKFLGTTISGQSMKNGKFDLPITGKGNLTLVASHIGFKSATVVIASQTELTIVLQEDKIMLDEVVVVNIGYSSVAKSKLAGSISSVTEKDLKDFPVSSVAEALAGKLAGVSVTRTEGAPGADINIKVRGGTSLTQDNSPLYIVDGVQLENALSILAPDEIATIDVLKDVASTSIYGARGANGVVLITTKSGKRGRSIVTFNTYAGARKVTNEIDVMKPYDFVQYQYELAHLHNNGYFLTDTANAFAKKYGAYNDLDIYKSMPMADWQDRVFGQTAGSNSQVISLSGGGEGTTYYTSMNNYKEAGVMLNSGLKRTLGSFRFETKISNKFKVGVNARYSQQLVTGTGTADATTSSAYNTLKNIVRFQPYDNGLINVQSGDEEGVYDATVNLSNPVTAAKSGAKNLYTNVLFTSGTLTYTITPKLIFTSILGYNVLDRKLNSFFGLSTFQVANTQTLNAAMPYITLNNINTKTVSNTNTLNYRAIVSPTHTLDLLVGQETNQNDATSYDQSIKYFPTSVSADQAFANVQQANPPAGAIQAAPTSSVYGDRLLSFFGRAMYSYRGKYNLNVSVRRDGSSKFASATRWGTFPSAQFAWRMSDEQFMQDLKLKWLGYLKMRLSYGNAGNNRVPINSILYQTMLTTSATNAGYAVTDASNSPGLYSANLANANLKWETIISRNLGFDMELFKGRLSLSLDFYINHTKDLLLNSNIPQQTGYITQYQNIGKTENKGVELQLTSVLIKKKDFTYTASFNISSNKNTIKELQTDVPYGQTSAWGTAGDDFWVQVGKPVGQYYGYLNDGFYTVDDFDRTLSNISDPTHAKWVLKQGIMYDNAVIGQGVAPGVMKLKKLTPSKGIMDTAITGDDRIVLGNNQPLFFGGFNNQFTYKNFDLTIFINFSYGSKTYNANVIENSSAYKAVGNNVLAKFTNRWKTFDDNGQFVNDWDKLAAMNANAKIYAPTRGNYILYSDAIEDGSFLRINNVSLGYSLPKKLLQHSLFSTIRVYATVNNLYTFSNYSGFDPEASTRKINPLTPGVDYSAYPRNRFMLVGINIGL
ncbi:SusC/RagA family TonB-linked outer membrane protein [Parasediminibacterium sp. JCM 36343]|uniref:SusC/RagA family TonB-linked outer membrane protein n=1 Tax=Parasediminibacterium sp. JCM 36343 TaxID=3374279 RepID=UPI00397AA3E9